MVIIQADHRETDSGIPTLLSRRGDLTVRIVRLRVGDYLVGGAVAVERKSRDDLARSIVDGRLFAQMGGLRRSCLRPLLVVEGLVFGHPVRNVSWPALRGALVSVTAVFGVPVLYSAGPEETAEFIATAASQISRSLSSGYVRPGYRPKGWRKRALYILQGLPAVGPARATSLLDALGSVRAVVQADERALREVCGIGRGVARRILAAVGERPDQQLLAAP